MTWRIGWMGLSALLLIAPAAVGQEPSDADGDGIADEHEQVLGTDPHYAEPLRAVLEDGLESDARRKQDSYDAAQDVVRIEFCHVGGDRYLWRATMAAPPRPDRTVFHLYVDADADSATGRKGPAAAASTGTEYMLNVVGGRSSSGFYDAHGNRTSGPPVSFVVQGNQLLISADIHLGRDQRGVRYALYVLCHTLTESGRNPAMSDAIGKKLITGVPLSDRKKIMRPGDYRENFRVQATFGVGPIRAVLKQDDLVVVPHDQLQRDGFIIDHFTTRRWPHLRRERDRARVWTRAPKRGRYHVGFMMYDDSHDERVGIYIDGKLCGIAVANQDNNQTWLYWLEQAREFRGGERVELRAAGANGRHGICNILFLAHAPQPRAISYRIDNMASACQVAQPGRVTVSWTTTWPCATRFQYGTDTAYGSAAEQEGNCLVHRVVLDGLDPHRQYHGRAIGTRRDGSHYVGPDYVFRAAPPPSPATRPERAAVPLMVHNPHGADAENWPISTGVPFPQGELGSAEQVRLLSGDREVPAQVRVTGRWLDGSVKWLLVTFQADAVARGQATYRLEYGRRVRRAPVKRPVAVRRDGRGAAVDTGALRFRIDLHGNLTGLQNELGPLLPSGSACHSVAVDEAGRRYSTTGSKAAIEIEEAGPVRAVIKVTSHLVGKDKSRLLRVQKRVEAYRGADYVRIHHTIVVDRPEPFTSLKSLVYRVPCQARQRTWEVPTVGGRTLRLGARQPAVRQRFDDELVAVSGAKESPVKDRIVGAIIDPSAGGLAAAARDFWQNYPKAFAVAPDHLDIGLCPELREGLYDKFPFEKEGHHLYYYLLGGRYRLKRGVSKTHELFLCFAPPERRRPLCSLFQRRLLATAPPAWYCGSKAFYDVAPRDTRRFQLYEAAIDRNLEQYAARRERQHDFGMLNYGDWYGERGSNWGNIEYDTQHAFFLEYIRSGTPAAFFLGEVTELHNRDIDTVQWSPDEHEVGAVYVHQMCHVGGYYDKSVPGTRGFPRAGYTVSHAWVEGHFDHYFLTGDPRSKETGRAVADLFIRKQLGRPYDFSSTRTPGWHLIMLAAAYHATGDPYYLNAAKVVVEHVLETQDTDPRPLPPYQRAGRQPYQRGGWSRMMVPGHCRCEPRHRGNAGFMIAVLLSGLKYYHDVTGDPRVKRAIILGAHYLLDETYSDQVHGFRYTSCPNTSYRPGASPLMVEGIARAYLWTKEERFRRVLVEALPRAASGSSYGKGFSMYYRMAPRMLADLAAANIPLADHSP